MTAVEVRREEILAVAEQHELELQEALNDVRLVVKRPFEVGEHLKTYVGAHPLPWLATALLLGVWFGSRD
ncbi:MAG: hypothetical protein ABI629_14075 [bacterium]